MSQCHNCGKDLHGNADACPECGTRVYNENSQGRQHRPQSMESTPTGIKFVSLVLGLSGMMLLLLGVANWVFAKQVAGTDAENSAELASTIGDFAIGIAVLGLVAFVATYGIWKLRGWGWLVGIGYFAIHALAGLVFVIDGRTLMLIYVAVIASLLAYLWRKRELYGANSYLPGSGPQANQY